MLLLFIEADYLIYSLLSYCYSDIFMQMDITFGGWCYRWRIKNILGGHTINIHYVCFVRGCYFLLLNMEQWSMKHRNLSLTTLISLFRLTNRYAWNMETSTTTDFLDETSQERNWKRFSEWIHCICVVTFDLELGQAMEVSSSILCVFEYTYVLQLMTISNTYVQMI